MTSSVRKLAAIMFTDMVGYSALAQTHEDIALDLLDEHRRLLRPLLARYAGREVETIGDAFFVEFDSALEATRCAIAIQEALHERNTAAGDAIKIVLRIGLHLGDVVHRGEHVHGDGVNIAARVESCAEPGGIALSEDIARQVGNKLDVRLESIGRRQLKNILMPMEIFRVVLPWLHTSSPPHEVQPNEIRNTLPAQFTSFIGRQKEEDEVKGLINRHSLVTLTGPGGTGKTRLAIQIANSLKEEFIGGICFVPLAAITNHDHVPSAIVQSLGIRTAAGREPHDLVLEALRGKRTLLILDNFEHVIQASSLIGDLLGECPDLRIIVTSRVVLRVRGEQEYPVPPLRLPDIKHLPAYASLTQYASVELFVQRSMAVKPDFSITSENAPAVAEICFRLDGLPLAIELAAARTKLFSPQTLLARLGNSLDLLRSSIRETPSRHQTLRQAIAWSYELLSDEEKMLFARISVFSGGCSLDAAATVCTTGLQIDPLDAIVALLDKSLVRKQDDGDGETRFYMLETIREFGLECLKGSGEEHDVCRTHAGHFAEFAEMAELQLTGSLQGEWFDRLETDIDNFRSAIHWAQETGESVLAVRLCAALWRFWITRGYMLEGLGNLKAVLADLPEGNSRDIARALNGLGTILHELGEYQSSLGAFHQSLEMFRALKEEKWEGTVLNNLAWVSVQSGDIDAAQSLSEEARQLHERLNDQRGVAVAFNNLGWVAHLQGNYDVANSLNQKNLMLRESLGDKRGVAYAQIILAWTEVCQGKYGTAKVLLDKSHTILTTLGDKQMLGFNANIQACLEYAQGRFDAAEVLIDHSIFLMSEIGNKWGVAYELSLKGDTALQQGKLELARSCFMEGLEHFSRSGSRWGIATVQRCFGDLYCIEQRWDDAIREYKTSLGLRTVLGDQRGVCECLEGLTSTLLAQNNAATATNLLGMADAIRDRIGAPRWIPEQSRYIQMIDLLDPQSLANSQEKAKSISLAEVLTQAVRAL